jgi:hypothetical protein
MRGRGYGLLIAPLFVRQLQAFMVKGRVLQAWPTKLDFRDVRVQER